MPLTRWLLLWTVLPLLALTAIIVAIHTQPYDDPDLRTLFDEPECPAPCFMNIQPGITPIEEAARLLEQHEWVERVEPHTLMQGSDPEHVRGWLFWDWSNRAPVWLRASGAALDHAGALATLDGVVDRIILATRIPFGRLRTLYGLPDGYSLSLRNLVLKKGVFSSATLHYQHIYLQHNLTLEAITPCQEQNTLWQNNTEITLFSEARQSSVASNFFLDRPFLEQMVYIRKLLCHP